MYEIKNFLTNFEKDVENFKKCPEEPAPSQIDELYC